ncbi:MAG: NAD-dependent epimerase/dehydratase family protein [Rhodospirillaceae bacterium]|nr:NAD-dependent epimerase/dehydratase family protein [Rhodospirillaceae bacterium]
MNRRSLLLSGIASTWAATAAHAQTQPNNRGAVLVFGGTGKLGSEVVKLLVAAGDDVTVFTRQSSGRELLAGLKVEYAIGDMADDKSVAAAFDSKKFRAVIDASANREPGAERGPAGRAERRRGGPEGDSKGFYEATMAIMAAHAKRTGVNHFILHGSVLAGDNIELFPQFALIKGSGTLIDKGRAEKILIDSDVPYTIIRHGRVPSDPQPPATGHARLTLSQDVFGDLTRADLAILTLDCLDNPARINKIYHAWDDTFKIDRPLPTAPRGTPAPSKE